MKRFFERIGRFFWSWGFLKFVLWMATIIILLYAEEDWRGARAWAAAKAEWEAKGETFDYNKFIPSPIPDEQNLAALPLFKLERVKSSDGSSYFSPLPLQRAMRTDLPGNDLPRTGNYQRGELPDKEKIRNGIAINYATVFKGKTPLGDTLVQFEALYPFITDLVASSATRPLCRFNLDYTVPVYNRAFVALTTTIRLSKLLTLHAVLALNHQQPGRAMEDIRVNYKLLSGVQRDPSQVGSLIAIGINAITEGAIYDGLAQHFWSDTQLLELEQVLEPVDFLSDYQFSMRSEIPTLVMNVDCLKNVLQDQKRSLFKGSFLWPDGWWDDNKSQIAEFILRDMALIDPRSHRAFPERSRVLQEQVDHAVSKWDAYAPWNVWFTLAGPSLDNVAERYAEGQVWVDEARIALALERYRLAHGIFPKTLTELTPAYIDTVPHDLINGEPYHYQLQPDGTFFLYSVGWNGKDDGGKVVYEHDHPQAVDYNAGDWVWPVPKKGP